MSILDALTRDLDWREGEIASMRIMLLKSGSSPLQQSTLLRAAWALLYAHYEGFVKYAFTAYFDSIENRRILVGNLPLPTRLLALRKHIRVLRTMSDGDCYREMERFSVNHLLRPCTFAEIDTKSNLWPDLLAEILESADLNASVVRHNEVKLKTLVSRRNGIAHGERSFIPEVSYYRTYENAVYDVLYDIAFQMDARLASFP